VATTLAWIVLGLPLLGAVVLSLIPNEPPRPLTRLIGCGTIGLAFVLAVIVFAGLLGNDADDRSFTSSLYEWIDIGGVTVDVAVLVDPLSVMMMLIITGIGFLIHVYSTEYMNHDRDYRRFFAQMNFFVFAMLLLVLSANFLFLIVGWGLVGLASYLLIGFYYDRPVAVHAARKAFVMNVIGDVGMVLGAFLIVREIGTLDYAPTFAWANSLPEGSGVATAVALLLVVGAVAKSGQIPLHSWLPDAMAGPTPVSALIHAATMVTAGVYLVVRTHSIFDATPVAAGTVAVIGAVTLFFAATVAIAQVDIKRVLAYSTVSQIGYMIMAAGLGAYASGMFHLLTHAFFKALLFLSAGIAIHALADEQSLDRMGNLRRYLRVAYLGIGVGCLAIAAVPPFSGFFSKDEILSYALDAGPLGIFCWVVGELGALITAFYMFRLLFRAFWGSDPEGGYEPKPHPSGPAMAVPVLILAVGATFIGWIQVPFGWQLLSDWLDPVLADVRNPLELTAFNETLTIVVSVAMALGGIGLAWVLVGASERRRKRLAGRYAGARHVLENAYHVDDVYEEAFVATTRDLGDGIARGPERYGVDGVVTATATGVTEASRGLRRVQGGFVRSYAFAMALGLGVIGLILVLVTQ
jgi:NADH-quinone oxidoreductase subunit L